MTSPVLLLTGASGTIGKAIAARFALDGYTVVLCGRRRNRLAEVAADLPGGPHPQFDFDVSDVAGISDAVRRTMTNHGRIDALVNNAGGWSGSELLPFVEKSYEQLVKEIEDNLTSAVLLSRAVLPAMLARGYGRIVNISSIAGIVGLAGHGAYSAAKAGQSGLARQLATEYGGNGVTVNCVAPGPVSTPMLEKLIEAGDPGILAMIDATPSKRPARPEEVAGAVAYFCSADAGHVNGQVLTVDGGMTAT